MRDGISIPRVTELHPAIRDEVKQVIEQLEAGFPAGTKIRIVQGLRTIEYQDKLYAQGRTTPGAIVTKAKGGASFHNYGLAIDYAIMEGRNIFWDHPLNKAVIKAFKGAGFTWGGDFKSITDKPHFEKTFGLTWRQLLARHNAGKFILGTKYVII